jgi:hypothetical protein
MWGVAALVFVTRQPPTVAPSFSDQWLPHRAEVTGLARHGIRMSGELEAVPVRAAPDVLREASIQYEQSALPSR